MSYEDWIPDTSLDSLASPDQSSEGFKSPLDGKWYWSAIRPREIDFILGWDRPANCLYFFGWVTPVPVRSFNFGHEGMVFSYLGERPWNRRVWDHLLQNGRKEVLIKSPRDLDLDWDWYLRMNEFWVWRYRNRESIGPPKTFVDEFRFWEMGEGIG